MENTIQSDLIRGHINTIILKALFDGDRYGYDIVREIEQKSSGQYKLKQPTLYSCLKRLEIQGFIRSYWGAKSNGGRRKYFTLTEMGRELFLKNQSEWEYSRTVIDKLISDKEVDLNAVGSVNYSPDESDDNAEMDIESDGEEQPFEDGIADSRLSEEDYTAYNDTAVQPESEVAASDTASEYSQVENEESPTENAEPAPIVFSDTSAIMDELFRRQAETDESYAEKLVSEKYVSDRTDVGMSADLYFKDFFDEAEDIRAAIQSIDDEPREEPVYAAPAENGAVQEERVPAEEDIREEESQADLPVKPVREPPKPDNIFLDYHTSKVTSSVDDGIIEREYRNIIGDFLNPCFIDRTPPAPVPEPQQQAQPAPQVTEPGEQEDYPDTAEQYPEYEEPAQPQDSMPAEMYEEESEQLPESNEQYTADADVNRKLNRITGEVRGMGDNVVIRTHNSDSSKEYSNAYHYLSNKLMLVHYGILFGVMMLEILFSAVFVNLVLHQGRAKVDGWVYAIAVVVAAAFPIVAFIKNFRDPDKRKRINFSLKNSLIYRFIVMAQCWLIIYCANVIGGMPLGFSAKYITTLLLPALLAVCFPISALIFNALFKSKKFSAER